MPRFVTKLDDLTRIITFTVFIMVGITFIFLIQKSFALHQPELIIAPALTLILLGVTALFRTTAYQLEGGTLSVLRPAGKKEFAVADVEELKLVTKEDLGFGLRTFGSGGFFGYFGRFVYKNAGKVTMYATDRSKMLLIRFRDEKQIIITPDDTRGFIDAFNQLKKNKR